MHKLAMEFLNKDKENRSIYEKVIATHDRYYTNILVERFYYYMFKIYFISYIEKSIRLKSLEIKNKKKKSYERELYILNSIDEDFKEEKINTIADRPIDYVEEIFGEMDINNISSNKNLNEAIVRITSKQKIILFMRYIQDKEEKQIAEELNISKQSVNKVKLAGLKSIRNYLGGEINGRDFQ
ncbi:MAG: sigma factor-like helix-turn-helix DNA-binding protein [Mammaliicoccus vitulinus]